MIDEQNLNNQLRRNGFCLVKNFFSPKEVQELRSLIIQNRDKNQDVYSSIIQCGLGKILMSNKYFNLLKKIIGEDLVYYKDSHLLIDNDKQKTGTFHIDARNDNVDPSSNEYKVWRVGMYLQDHKNFSGGIKMIYASHKKFLLSSFKKTYHILSKIFRMNLKANFKSFMPSLKYFNIPSEAGDLIIWNGRTHHCGRFRRLKFLKNLNMHPFFDRALPDFLFAKENEDRLVIFQNWCLKDKTSENYINYRLSQVEFEDYWKKNKLLEKDFPSSEFENANITLY